MSPGKGISVWAWNMRKHQNRFDLFTLALIGGAVLILHLLMG